MEEPKERYEPGRVRDTIRQVLEITGRPMSIKEIVEYVAQFLGPTPASSVRSYLRLNTPGLFARESRGFYSLNDGKAPLAQERFSFQENWRAPVQFGKSVLHHADCFDWIKQR